MSQKSDVNDIMILALDTSSKDCSICITQNDRVLVDYHFRSDNDLSTNIINIIDHLLKQVGINISDIDVFGIGTGPGIFTGIRVGMATIKGLAFESGKKVVPVNILNATASLYKHLNRDIIPIIDAKRNFIYIAGYRIENKILNEILKSSLVEVSKLNTLLKVDGNYTFVGSGSIIYKDNLESIFVNSENLSEIRFFSSEIARIAYNEACSGNGINEIDKLNPLYIRRTDAEENYERNNKKGC